MTFTGVRDYRQKKWCKSTATFSSRAARGAISEDMSMMMTISRSVRNAVRLCDRVWFGSANNWMQPKSRQWKIFHCFVTASDCDLVIVAGTTALFGYIIDWALRARG